MSQVLADLQSDPTDQGAWADLYRRMWPHVLSMSHHALDRAAVIKDAEDVAQDVFVRLAVALHDGKLLLPDNETTFRTLLAVMTRNRAMDFLRHARRKSRDVHRNEALAGDVPSSEPEPGDVAMGRDLFEQLLSRSDPLQQRMLYLLVEGRDQAEVARQLGISVRTAQRHLEVLRARYVELRETKERI